MATLQWILILYFAIINLTAFALFGIDKRRAVRNKWRIPERTLLLAAFLGGSAGSLIGMLLFHHKTRKAKFFIPIPLLLILHIWLFITLFLRAGIMLL